MFIHYKSGIATAIVVDEDDNVKFRPERVKNKILYFSALQDKNTWFTYHAYNLSNNK